MAGLRDIWGLGGYLEQNQINQQAGASQLSQLAQQMQIAQAMQKQQEQAQLRGLMESTGGDLSAAIPALLKSGNVDAAAKLEALMLRRKESDDLAKFGTVLEQRLTSAPSQAPPVAVTPSVTSNFQGDPKSILAEIGRAPNEEQSAMLGAFSRQLEGAPQPPTVNPRTAQAKVYRDQAEKIESAMLAGHPKDPRLPMLRMQAQSLRAQAEKIEEGSLRREQTAELQTDRLTQQGDLARERMSQQAELARQRSEDQRLSQQERFAAREENIRLIAALRAAPVNAAGGEKDINGQIERFATRLQTAKVAPLVESARAANDLLKNYEDKDVPGLGLGVGSAMIPNALRSTDANNVRSSLKGVTNDLLNMYSGLAVTLPESERRELEQMQRGDFSVAEFKLAWPRVMNRMNAVIGNLKAGITPEAVNVYQTRPGAISLDPIAPAFSQQAGPVVGTVKNGYRFKGGDPAVPASWEKL